MPQHTVCQVRPSMPQSNLSSPPSSNLRKSTSRQSNSRDRRRDCPKLSRSKSQPCNTPPPRRFSNRVCKPSSLAASSRSGTPQPPSSPSVTTNSTNRRTAPPRKTVYTAPTDSGPIANWDSVTFVRSDQSIESTYSKERQVPEADDGAPKVYGKLVTKTITMTITTTIATTEIVHPDEGAAYLEALERQQRSQNDPQAEKVYVQARQEAAGMKDLHEQFHKQHHRTATPAVITSSNKI